ncbi:AAA family ATPase [Saccharothrix obliqua]|uniref:AAA family ATPase n=1 Tax=Saccharothrix obliqua TaxID=2861747 RepID=UPI001C5F1F57|nr:SMC family ATPase [Saccharothrix obliqua]MBW4719224.1 SMC family ATPase [Saccharothrix obliqua]
MKLHRLAVSAFGPYPGREEVDFDLLGADGLFLLHGDTGAGKTTLLDAVAFALFGKVPGARGQVKRLRCDYADRDTPTEVSLELTVRGRRFRVVRAPEYDRPKKRGEGVTRQPAKASLTWLDGWHGEGHTRIDDVAREVESLLGLTAEQFFQVVLLPQGEFANFLRAETAEREKLLERLFGTERFLDVERWFRDRRRDRRRELDELARANRDLVQRVAEAAGEEPPEDGDPEWLSSLLKQLAEVERDARRQAETAAGARGRAETAWRQAQELAERVRRVRGARDELARCAAAEPRRVAWVRERDAARRAAVVVPAQEAVRKLERALAAAEAAERAAADAAAAFGADAGAAGSGYLSADPRAAAERCREEAGGLTRLVAEAERQRVDERRVAELARRAEEVAARLDRLVSALAAAPERVAAARSAVEGSAVAAARLEAVAARAAAARELPGAVAAARVAEERRRAAVDAHQGAKDVLLRVRQQRLDGMAAELAASLRAGDACPVCGATDHPRPAPAAATAVTAADEDAAATAEQAALDRRTAAERADRDAAARVAVLRESVGDDDPAALVAEHRALAALADRRAEHAAALADLERRVEAATAERSGLEREAAELVAARRELADTVRERADLLAEARGDFPDVPTRRAHLLDLADALTALADRRAAVAEQRERLAEHRVDVARLAAEAGFADVAEALAAARPEHAVADLEARVREVEDARLRAESVLAELTDVDPDAEVDVAGTQARYRAAQDQAEQAANARADAARRAARASDLAARLTAAWAELEPVAAEFAELDALTDVINGMGQNTDRMTLRTYVLAARLEEVAVAASTRLERMSQGRYRFVHSVEAGPRGTRGGLGLDVLDDYSGQRRPAKTLSGGESFLASLALALGLSDVVAAGAVLDTLFIDEGFGTLDAETLELVMNTLDELRAGGRVIGIVSHVEELRRRIPTRLRVRKARGGSSLETTS